MTSLDQAPNEELQAPLLGEGKTADSPQSLKATATADGQPSKKPPFVVLPTAAFVSLLVNVIYAIPATFLPRVLEGQGVEQEVVGYLFGICPLACIFVSPFVGYASGRLGGKPLLVFGMCVVGLSTILFGVFDKNLTAMFVVRALLGFGQAFVSVGVNSIVAHYYSGDNIGSAMGLIEIGTSLGIVMGPPIGGLLFKLTSFLWPFALSGGLMLLGIPVVVFFFPSVYAPHQGIKKFSIGALFSGVNIVMSLTTVISMTGFCFLDPTLSIHMGKYLHLSEDSSSVWVGLMFLGCALTYGFTAMIAGKLTDVVGAVPCILFGLLITTIGFFLLGPLPVRALDVGPMWLRVVLQNVALMFLAAGGSFSVIPTMPCMTKASKQYGSMGVATASGLWTAASSAGEVLGPVGGALLVGRLDKALDGHVYGDGFAWTTVVLGFMQLLAFIMVLVLGVGVRMGCCIIEPNKDEGEEADLPDVTVTRNDEEGASPVGC